MAVIGLDVGSTQVKCGVYGEKGNLTAVFSQEYAVCYKDGCQYADTRAMWVNVKGILSQAAKGEHIEAICVTSFGESFVPVTKNFEILGGSMLYTDPRGTEETEFLKRKITQAETFEISGNVLHAMYAMPKIIWLKNNRPQVYEKADYFLPIASFIEFMLSGAAACDYSLAARMALLNIGEKKWSERLLSASGIAKEKLPLPVLSGTVIGTLRKEIAEGLQIAQDCLVVVGAHDQIASALGAGVLDAGSSVDGIGTVECITPVFAHQVKDANAMAAGVSCVPYVKDGLYVSYMFNYTGGALIKWFRDKIVPENAALLKAGGQSFYDYYGARMPDGPTGLFVLPHFNGAATPYMDSLARGAILNLNVLSTAADIYKGIMEGCTYEMRLNLETGKKSGIAVKELIATGGGANSKEWLQIKADITGVPVYPLETADAGIAGCAMLALVAVKKAKNLYEAADMAVKKKAPYYPGRERAEKYDVLYEKYKKIFGLIKELR